MCAQWMDCDILYSSQVNKSNTFQELTTRAHDMELTIAHYGRWLNNDGPTISLRNRNSMLRVSHENGYLIVSQMHQKWSKNFLRKHL